MEPMAGVARQSQACRYARPPRADFVLCASRSWLSQGILNAVTAARLRARLALLALLQRGAVQLRPGWEVDEQLALLGLPGLPAWWRPGHDAELVAAVLRHGFGAWDAVLADPAVTFGCTALAAAAAATEAAPAAAGNGPVAELDQQVRHDL